jgi:hypothetical protein
LSRVDAAGRRIAIEQVRIDGAGGPITVLSGRELQQPSGVSALAWTRGGLVFARGEGSPVDTAALYRLPLDPERALPRGTPVRLFDLAGAFIAELTADAAGRRLAYVRIDAQEDVWVADLAEGGRTLTRVRRLTASQRDERPSGWSGEDRVLWFGDAEDGCALWSGPVGGDPPARLEVGERGDLSWPVETADGALVYFRMMAGPEHGELELVRAQGGIREVAWRAEVDREQPAWRRFPTEVRVRCAGGSCVRSTLDGEQIVFAPAFAPAQSPPLARVARRGWFAGWALSPDGGRVAVPTAGELWLVPLRGGGPIERRPVAAECDLQFAAWDDEGALFATGACEDTGRRYRLYRVDRDGTPRLLRASPNVFFSTIEPSPRGRHLAFGERAFDTDVWLYDE